MTGKKERILKGILNNLHAHFFGYVGLVTLADYMRDQKEATITLALFAQQISGVSTNVLDIKMMNEDKEWLSNECGKRKFPYEDITEVIFTMIKKSRRLFWFITDNLYTCMTEIVTKDKTYTKTTTGSGWI